MGDQQLAALAGYYEEYLHGAPQFPGTKQARFFFNDLVKKLYELEPENLRQRMTLQDYRQGVIMPELEKYLSRNQTPFPTLTPEKTGTSDSRKKST